MSDLAQTLLLFALLSIGAAIAFGIFADSLAVGAGTLCTIWALNATALLAVQRMERRR